MVNLVTTDSYFELFPILADLVKDKSKGISGRNLIFCEAKVSLMVERFLTGQTGGSFNTDVYSFGNYLSAKKHFSNLLSKEGSAMVIKKILSSVELDCLKNSRTHLAPSLFNLIILLKSAKVTPELLRENLTTGNKLLTAKLNDIEKVYSEYERFINENGFDDQSSVLSYLPQIINQDDQIKKSDVYLIGYKSFTAQAREIVDALINNARSVTAILTEGDNPRVFVNETANFIRQTCKQNGHILLEKKIKSNYTNEGKLFLDNIFSFTSEKNKKASTDKISCLYALNSHVEAERVAQIIKSLVMKGKCRYKDITVALPDVYSYSDDLKSALKLLDVPFFSDEKKKPQTHPLISLITSYVDVFNKNFERSAFIGFIKNPLVIEDKKLSDRLENFLVENNLNYGRIKEPFKISENDQSNILELEQTRLNIVNLFNRFSITELLESISVKEKLYALGERLKVLGEQEEYAVNEQIYDAVVKILEQMQKFLGGVKLTYSEFKSVFTSGVSALELSIIPQYNDAVFIGDYKQTALAKAKYLFALGLNSSVPEIKQDVALITDEDINVLEKLKITIEPKIKIVNHRSRESVALALCAFEEGLYLSCPIFGTDGGKTIKSEVFSTAEKLFTLKDFPEQEKYLTKKQGLKSFALEVGEFAEGRSLDMTQASSYYRTVGGQKVEKLLDDANKTLKVRLDDGQSIITGNETSPTTIEDYFHCPYRAFLSHSIKLKTRKMGRVDSLMVGNVIHEIMNGYAKKMSTVSDKLSSDALVEEVYYKVLSKKEYGHLLNDEGESVAMTRIKRECKSYCYKTFLSLVNTRMKPSKTEVSFGSGENCDFPPISLADGKVKLKGKIDRIDQSQKYFRIIDYKTGKPDESDKALFSGTKLQLMLYGQAVKQVFSNEGKELAGLYYLPVTDRFELPKDKQKCMARGKTLNEELALADMGVCESNPDANGFIELSAKKKNLVGALSKESLSAYTDYAYKVSQRAVERMDEGYVMPSPYEDACSYCQYKGLCPHDQVVKRKLESVNEQTVFEAVKGEE